MEDQPTTHNNPIPDKINHRSMSDAESQTSQVDSFHSPLRSDSPFHSEDPFPPQYKSPSKAIVSADKYYTSLRSPTRNLQIPPQNYNFPPSSPPEVKTKEQSSPVVVLNRLVREGMETKVGSTGRGGEEGFGGGEVGGEKRSRAAVASIVRRTRKEVTVNRVALLLRVCEVVFCLISFSVMAADKTQGWSGDSFDRYREYRYCLAVTVIAFAYAGFQSFDLAYNLITGKHIISHHLRYHFDFSLDQILAYLLISASSSAATRVDDWVSNWGKDEFTEMASASVGMSFLAFAAFALSSLVSGYNLCSST